MSEAPKEWFEEWFESPYYDILYARRDEKEAGLLIDNLLNYLSLHKESKILDLACGKGRHSVYLNNKGFDVTGSDLSERSIKIARTSENEKLKFLVQDMRIPLPQKFDVVFNLFTSFGYFDDNLENMKVLFSIKSMLNQGGIFIIDYLNGAKISNNPECTENKVIEGNEIKICKRILNGFVTKEIVIKNDQETKIFNEKVRLFSPEDFSDMFLKAGLRILNVFGDYNLNDFDPLQSERMIFITKVEE